AIGGRSPDFRWGLGALQELDQPPLFTSVTKSAVTAHDCEQVGNLAEAACATAMSPHQGPTFLDIPMDKLFTPAPVLTEPLASITKPQSDLSQLDLAIEMISAAQRPVFIAGGDIWQNRAEHQFLALVAQINIPVIVNGMARGILDPLNPLLVTPARSYALKNADLVIVAGTPLDFRLGYGDFGDAQVIFISDDPRTSPLAQAIRITGDLPDLMNTIATCLAKPVGTQSWRDDLAQRSSAVRLSNSELMATRQKLIHPAQIYGELIPRLTESTITIGDGGDFVSFAGKFIEPKQPGRWLDPGPFGALGTGMGYALAAGKAFPSDPLVVLLGDGAAGFSLMDVDSLVRHDVACTIVVGNNAGWGLERHPMRFLYGYDVLTELEPSRYDQVVGALGGAGEVITAISDLGPALDRAMNWGVPYLINVMTDPEVAYPRSTTGI
ncbi:MAG: thiamine pyrophosphate-dependent enzyme, partial [Candidatus Nanopelagicales bacterium]|nr:thiamine pyrophosphate-dependent enzyme [Candidatus Nanopelagicales bacterium]